MADDTDQQFDEYGQPIPSQEELEAQFGGPAQGPQVAVAPPPPVMPPPQAMPPGLQTTVDPSQQGRMYMGPALSAPQEAAFMQSAPGTRVAPPRGVVPPAASSSGPLPPWMANPAPPSANTMDQLSQSWGVPLAQAQSAVESAERMQAQRGYKEDLDKGVPAAEAMAKWGPILFSGSKTAMPRPVQPKPFQFHQGGTFNPNSGQWSPISGIKPPTPMDTVTGNGST